MRRATLLMLLFSGLLALNVVWAEQMVTEIIPLKYRMLDEIIPTLQPLVPPPGTVTGMNNQLVVRTTPDNLQAIRDVLAKLDKRPRKLMISVKQGRWEDLRMYLAEVTGSYKKDKVEVTAGNPAREGRGLNVSVEGDDGSRTNARVWSSRGRDDEVGVQRIQVLEGQEAFIQTGQSVPVADRSYGYGWRRPSGSVRYKDVSTGFRVVPVVNDDRVTLQISPHNARESRTDGGKFDYQAASTVVSGRLGEWMVIGGSQDDATSSGRGTVFSTRRDQNINQAILLKVTEMH